jgi:hypothetical protein
MTIEAAGIAEPTYTGGAMTIELPPPESIDINTDIDAAGRTRSFRYLIRGVRGRNIRCNCNLDGIIKSRQAVVHVTAGEAVPFQESAHTGPDGVIVRQNWAYTLGAAPVWVSNISPHFSPGGVEFLLQVEWGSPLNIGVTITVEAETPFQIQGF